MSGDLDALAAEAEAELRKPTAPKHPQGWEPGVVWDGYTGIVTTLPTAAPSPDWREVLLRAHLDPEMFEIVEPVQVRTWDAAIGEGKVATMRYYRCHIRSKRANAPDMPELLALVSKRPRVAATRPTGPESFVVPQSDWQLGKRGTPATVDRIVGGIDAAVERLKIVRRRPGRRIGSVTLPFLGDLGEACDGHYAMQTFEVELDYREQRRLGRRLAHYAVDAFAPQAERVIVPVVGGNHGENRKDGKAFTTFGDNQDVEIVEGVAEACAQNPARYGHVAFVIPGNDLTLALEVGGLVTGFTHGHLARRGVNSSAKVAQWWSGQAFGRRPVGDAQVLWSGHYHHLRIEEMSTGRWHVQVPTVDSGSQWFEETTGTGSTAGMLTVVQGPTGLHDWEVL